jgi:hypothetical protein
MKRWGYVAWINDEHYWHPSLASAQRRINVARLHGKDTFIYRLEGTPVNRRPGSLQAA